MTAVVQTVKTSYVASVAVSMTENNPLELQGLYGLYSQESGVLFIMYQFESFTEFSSGFLVFWFGSFFSQCGSCDHIFNTA
jgi:hypothetical protein